METTASGWKVIDRDAAVLTSTYAFAGKDALANSFVARLADKTLAVVSPNAGASPALLDELAQFGEVSALIANNGLHHLGLPEWSRRFPKARCFAPAASIQRIGKKNPAAPKLEPLAALQPLLGSDVGVHEAADSKIGESWVWAKVAGGHAWFLSDLVANMERLPPRFPVRQLFKWTGSAPGYKPFHLAMKFTLKDKRGTLKALAAEVAARPPTAVVPSHGGVLDHAGLAADTAQLLAGAIR